MVQINYRDREIVAKIVYYGPALSGKTTNLQFIHECVNYSTPTQFFSLNTKNDRTLFFDLLPINLGRINDFTVRIQLYTVPGQVQYNSTRKVVLAGCDAIVFVADSQKAEQEANLFSITNMKSNLRANGLLLEQIPWILQYNKRDLPDVMTEKELEETLNKSYNVKHFTSVATKGIGAFETFIDIANLMLGSVLTKYRMVRSEKELHEISKAVTTNLKELFGKYQEAKKIAVSQPEAAALSASKADVAFPEAEKPIMRDTGSGAAVQVGDVAGVDSNEPTQPIGDEAVMASAQSVSVAGVSGQEISTDTSRQPTEAFPVNPEEFAKQQRQVTTFHLGKSPSMNGDESPMEQEFLSNEQLVETAVQANMKITELSSKLAESELKLEKKLGEIKIVADIGKALTSELDLDTLLSMIVNSSVGHLGLEYASISLYDSEKKYLEPRYLHNLKDDPITAILGERLVKFLEGIINKGKMAVITSAENKSLANALKRYDNYSGFITVSLKYQEKLLGILSFYYKNEETYQKDDLRFVIMLATYASIAVENALLYKNISKSRNFLNSIISNAGEAIFTLSPVGRILTWNEAATDIFGYARKEVVGKNLTEILDVETAKRSSGFLKQVFLGNTMKDQPLNFIKKGGTPVEGFGSFAPVKGEDKVILSCSALIHATGDGMPAAKPVSDGFLKSVAFELEPQIHEAVEKLALTEKKLKNAIEDDKSNSFQQLKAAVQEMARVADNVLKYKRIKEPVSPGDQKIETVNISDLLMSLIYMRQEELNARKINLDVPADLPQVSFPQAALTQVFNNLISVSLGLLKSQMKPKLNIGGVTQENDYKFFLRATPVRTEGLDVDSLFNAESNDESRKGSVTLAVAQKILSKFDGEIWIDKKPPDTIEIVFTVPKL